MLYTFLISIVFIAELIILFAIITNLVKLDRCLVELNKTVDEIKPEIYNVLDLIQKISGQLVELAQDFTEDIRVKQEEMALRSLNKLLLTILLWKINSKFIRKIRKSKFAKTLYRGFAFVQSMV